MTLAANKTPGRVPLTIIEIQQDLCLHDYGVAPCTAAIGLSGSQKCWRTLETCQDPDNFAIFSGSPQVRNVLTLRFCTKTDNAPRDTTLIPSVLSVETSPAEVNISGSDKTLDPLGKRASVTIRLEDHPHRDVLVDPYLDERTYDPLTRGTFWSKWLARNPYHEGRKLRVLEGYVGQSLNEMMTRNYVLERIEGPTNGEVQIIAKDPLKAFDFTRTQVPSANTGRVAADFTEALPGSPPVTFDLTPTGIGDAEYSASGEIQIGAELMEFTRSGDTMTLTARGIRETEVSAHSANEAVQEAYILDNADAIDVIYDLMVTRAGLDPSYVPLSDWQAEADAWVGGFTFSTCITQPTSVKQILGEIVEQSLFFFWWDEIDQEIKLRVLRPFDSDFDGSITILNDDANFIAGSVVLERRPEERLTQVQVYFDQIDPTKDVSDPSNYRRKTILSSADASNAERFGSARRDVIYARLLDDTNVNEVLTIASRKLSAREDVPTPLTFDLDAKDQLSIGDFVRVKHHGLVDYTGSTDEKNYQITSVNPVAPGHRIEYRARRQVSISDVGVRYAFVTDDDAPDYDDATDRELLRGGWIAPDSSPVAFDDGGVYFRIV